jgi:predicted nucleic acid-binding protein
VRYVIDASVALKWFLEDEHNDTSESILESLLYSPELFAVPELFAYEVLSVLLRTHPAPLETYLSGVIPLLQGGVLRYPMTANIARRVQRMSNLGLTGYDASYAALAEELGGLWLTFDTRAYGNLKSEQLAIDLNKGLPAEWR